MAYSRVRKPGWLVEEERERERRCLTEVDVFGKESPLLIIFLS